MPYPVVSRKYFSFLKNCVTCPVSILSNRVKGPKTKGSVTVTDEEIISLFWHRNEDAIAETDVLYGRRLRRLSLGILQNAEDSEEVVSDTYLKTWNAIPKARPRYFYAYLAAICRNLSLNLLDWNRAAKRKAEVIPITQELEQCVPDPKQDASADGREIMGQLNAFLETLPKDSRLIFLRRYWYADSVSAIAKRYHMTESKVKMQLMRTRNQLKTHLEKAGIQI